MASGDENQRPTSVSSLTSDGQRSVAVKRKPQDFVFLKLIGEGAYSSVFLAKEVRTGQHFAVKVLNKNHIVRERKKQYVMREKSVFLMLDHPFFIRLAYTFQDAERLYFVLNYAKGGELLDYLPKKGSFDLECSKFYTAEIVEALQHLRELNIIHRDLKPENILLNEHLHIQITDFGSAKILTQEHAAENETAASGESSERGRTNSFVGTAQYVSPEVLNSKKAFYSSDLWALGCILYQFLSGNTPFTGGHEYQIFQKITKLEYEFPEGFNETAKDLVQNLLVLDPTDRLGCDEKGGFLVLKDHAFFEGIDFQGLPEATPPLQHLSKSSESFHNSDNLPTGLDERRMVELFSDFSANQSHLKEENENIEKWHTMSPLQLLARRNSVPDEERSRRLREQAKGNEYHKFVEGNLIIKQGLIDKKKGLFARRRMFLLTEGPHLYYVDPVNKVLKGQIPWSKELKPEAKNFKIFFVHTPNRTYYLEDPESKSQEWVQTILEVWQQYYRN